MGPLATTEEGPSRIPIKSSQNNEETTSKFLEVQAILQKKSKGKKRRKISQSKKQVSIKKS
jgi:hypothetical protein